MLNNDWSASKYLDTIWAGWGPIRYFGLVSHCPISKGILTCHTYSLVQYKYFSLPHDILLQDYKMSKTGANFVILAVSTCHRNSA